MISAVFQKSFYSLLVRPSNNFAVLDGLRAMSILWVICSHIIFLGPSGYLEDDGLEFMYENTGLFYAFWLNGFYGVDCFFVLSGLLISNIIFREIDKTGTLNLESFYIRRILRLSPALIVVALFSYFSRLPNYENILYNIFYLNNFLPLSENVIGHTWSLSVEEQFYIAFAIFMFFSRNSKHILLSIIALLVIAVLVRFGIVLYFWKSIAVQLYDLGNAYSDSSENYIELVYFKPYTRYGGFLFGVLAMYLYRYHHDLLGRVVDSWAGKAAVYISIMIILSVAFSNLYVPSERPSDLVLFVYHCFIGYLFSAALSIVMLVLLMRSDTLRTIHWGLSHRVLYPIAQLAYSLYLTHPLIIDMVTIPVVTKMSGIIWPDSSEDHVVWPLVNLSVTLFIGTFVATLMYVVVEKPFMDLRNIFLKNDK